MPAQTPLSPASPAFGFVNAFKPAGVSSTYFGSWVKRLLGADALGHWGTLDPTACGVLVLAVGKATRLLPLLVDSKKRYNFELVVGASTDSADAGGKVLRFMRPPVGWGKALPAVAESLVGKLEQVAPMLSAVKVAGAPLYRLARRGLNIPRPARTTFIHELHVMSTHLCSARLSVLCDAGTYVRTLCEEIGRRLGLPAHMGMLLRSGAGPFMLANALLPCEIRRLGARALVDPLDVLSQCKLQLGPSDAARFAHGNDVSLAASLLPQSQEILVLQGARLIGTAKVLAGSDGIVLRPSRILVCPGC